MVWSVIRAGAFKSPIRAQLIGTRINAMHSCNFHPEVLACGGLNTNSSACLSAAQISNLHRIYTPWWGANNSLIFDGLAPGSEAGFSFLFNGATPQFGT